MSDTEQPRDLDDDNMHRWSMEVAKRLERARIVRWLCLQDGRDVNPVVLAEEIMVGIHDAVLDSGAQL